LYSDGSIDPLTCNAADKLPRDTLLPLLGSRGAPLTLQHSAPPLHRSAPAGVPITQPVMVATQGILQNHVLPSNPADSQSTVDTVSTVKKEEMEPELVSQFKYCTSITDQLNHE
jgi:hypothetical protein